MVTSISAYQVVGTAIGLGSITAASQRQSLLMSARDPTLNPIIAFCQDLFIFIQQCREKATKSYWWETSMNHLGMTLMECQNSQPLSNWLNLWQHITPVHRPPHMQKAGLVLITRLPLILLQMHSPSRVCIFQLSLSHQSLRLLFRLRYRSLVEDTNTALLVALRYAS